MTMRALLVLLAVLNLGVAAWWLFHDAAATPVQAEPPSGIARLALASEHPDLLPPPTPVAPAAETPPADAPAPASSPPATPPVADTCLRLGPFADADAAGKAQDALRAAAKRIAVREQQAQAGRDRGWRVYLPPAADRATADATADRLRAAGFKDLLVVGNGAEANGIALGRFSSEDRARQHAEALRAAGFEAKAEALGETKATYWLELAVAGDADAAALRRRAGAAQARPVDCAAAR